MGVIFGVVCAGGWAAGGAGALAGAGGKQGVEVLIHSIVTLMDYCAM